MGFNSNLCVELVKNAEVYQSAHKPLSAMTAEWPENKTLANLIELVMLLRSELIALKFFETIRPC